jgi:hypothetical protein
VALVRGLSPADTRAPGGLLRRTHGSQKLSAVLHLLQGWPEARTPASTRVTGKFSCCGHSSLMALHKRNGPELSYPCCGIVMAEWRHFTTGLCVMHTLTSRWRTAISWEAEVTLLPGPEHDRMLNCNGPGHKEDSSSFRDRKASFHMLGWLHAFIFQPYGWLLSPLSR